MGAVDDLFFIGSIRGERPCGPSKSGWSPPPMDTCALQAFNIEKAILLKNPVSKFVGNTAYVSESSGGSLRLHHFTLSLLVLLLVFEKNTMMRVHFSNAVSKTTTINPSSITHSCQEAGDALVTPLGLEIITGGGDYLLSDGSPVRLFFGNTT
ncbi:hypothetical protein EVAR_72099_1 [Eumeta japonica]|uniref:Uncharacterized protein n=1 Tax=Eumeta variegata TaxID=151549 RepID=A0A4C2AB11_EUMVA|nr:hypothetical protein EVAR_72099_1 [Eumeta japonica]